MFILIILFEFLHAGELVYKISLTDTPNLLKLGLEFYAGNNEQIILEQRTKKIRRFSVRYIKNKKKYRLRYTKRQGKIILSKTKGKNISITYYVYIPNYTDKGREVSFRDNNFLMLFARDIFLVPELLQSLDNFKIFIKYAFPVAWSYANSWTNRSGVSEIYSIQELYGGLITVGSLENKYIKIKDKMYLFSFYGFSKAERKDIIDRYTKIANKQISLWGYLPSEKILISLFKSAKVKKNIEGLQFNNVLIHYLKKNSKVDDIDVLRLFAHEHFHIWNGSYLKANGSGLEWFTEGFTDYYALLTLLQCGMLGVDEVLSIFSDRYIEYDRTNAKDSIIISLALDLNVIKASNGLSSLDDYIKIIETKASFWQSGYDNSALKLAFISLANWDFDDFFDKYIYNRESINMETLLASFGVESSVREECREDRQYKIKKYRRYKKVKQIVEGSNAYLSGLRLGDLILKEVVLDTGEILLKVLRRNKKFDITFDPRLCTKKIVWLKTKNKFFDIWLSNRVWK